MVESDVRPVTGVCGDWSTPDMLRLAAALTHTRMVRRKADLAESYRQAVAELSEREPQWQKSAVRIWREIGGMPIAPVQSIPRVLFFATVLEHEKPPETALVELLQTAMIAEDNKWPLQAILEKAVKEARNTKEVDSYLCSVIERARFADDDPSALENAKWARKLLHELYARRLRPLGGTAATSKREPTL